MTATAQPPAYQPPQPNDVSALRKVNGALREKRYHCNDFEGLAKAAHVTVSKLNRLTITLGLLWFNGVYYTLSKRGEEVLRDADT